MKTVMSAALPRGQTEGVCPDLDPGHRPLDRWELLSLVTDLRQELGLADRDVMVLRAHLSVLPQGPLRPNTLNVSFMEVGEIHARACGMDERRFRRGETRLEQVGLVRRRLSANGRRFPERDREGRIINAYGIDLSPIFTRYAELVELREHLEEKARRLRARKNSVSARLQSFLRSLTSAGRTMPAHLDELRIRLRNAVRRKNTQFEELDTIEAEVVALEALADCHATVREPVVLPSSARAGSTAHPDSSTADAGSSVRHIESKTKEKDLNIGLVFEPSTVSEAWKNAPTLSTFYPDIPRDARDAAQVLLSFSSFLGLDRQLIPKALTIFGWSNLVAVLDYLASRIDQITKPQGYLNSMMKEYESGQPLAGGRVKLRSAAHRRELAPAA